MTTAQWNFVAPDDVATLKQLMDQDLEPDPDGGGMRIPRGAAESVALLESLGIFTETTGRKRDRTYRYARYLDRLRTGTELIGSERR
jgi:hypothetical protein